MKKLFLYISLFGVLSINAQNCEFIHCIVQNDCVRTDTVYQPLMQNEKFVFIDCKIRTNK